MPSISADVIGLITRMNGNRGNSKCNRGVGLPFVFHRDCFSDIECYNVGSRHDLNVEYPYDIDLFWTYNHPTHNGNFLIKVLEVYEDS